MTTPKSTRQFVCAADPKCTRKLIAWSGNGLTWIGCPTHGGITPFPMKDVSVKKAITPTKTGTTSPHFLVLCRRCSASGEPICSMYDTLPATFASARRLAVSHQAFHHGGTSR